jgi:hypothetical protein
MMLTGNAFRPPRRTDDEGWNVAEQLVRAGHLFRSTAARQSMPRTRRELEKWLAAHASDPGWLPEKPLRVGADGVVRSGRRIVRDRELALVLVAGQWREGRIHLRGDGARRLASPVFGLSPRRYVAVDANTRVRLRCRD